MGAGRGHGLEVTEIMNQPFLERQEFLIYPPSQECSERARAAAPGKHSSEPSSLIAAVSVNALLFDSYEDREGMSIFSEVDTKIGRIANMTNDETTIKK